MGFRGSVRIILPNFVTIGQTITEIWLLFDFQNPGRPPSWSCYAWAWTACAKIGWFWRAGWCGLRNHPCQILCRLVQGFRSSDTPILSFSIGL